MSSTPRQPAAVRASINDHIKHLTAGKNQNYNLVRRRFVISRFLARVFDADPHGWILKGGIGMMVRLPHARYSKDIDLLVATNTQDPIDDLRRAVQNNTLDAFNFNIGPPRHLSGGKGSTVTVTAALGITTYDSFSIDIVNGRRELVGKIEHQQIPRLIDTDDFPPETSVQLYPLADQIADKLCAMYEHHGTTTAPSGRYRDLVDLLLISMFLHIDLNTTITALHHERTLRNIPTLPTTLESPGPTWHTQWATTARNSPLPTEQHNLDTALKTAGHCYNRILNPNTQDGNPVWNHHTETWDAP